jgi:hypothetical protein
MRKLLPDKSSVFQLQEYAVWENEDGSYEYMSWDDKSDELTWVSGKGMIIEDVLCLTSIASEGNEETFETKLDVEFELNQLPKWDKTQYYCVVLGGELAVLPQYCETGKPVKKEEEDYNAVKEMLRKHGATLQ